MWFAYLDESKDSNKFYVYSALIVESDTWNSTFRALKAFRQGLRKSHGIYIKQELHAWKFASGKGQIADKPINKADRAKIFQEVMNFVADPKLFKIISSVNTNEFYAFDRFINRINRTAEANETNVILICDEGQEAEFTRRLRKMRVHNLIPSNQGTWDSTGAATKNITTDYIIEDPFFKDSRSSYFIQLVDFCAYALLRSEKPIDSRTALGYDKMYDILKPITMSVNNAKDPRKLGIIR
jgi:hypothetical protein